MSLWDGAEPGDYIESLICCGDTHAQRAALSTLLRKFRSQGVEIDEAPALSPHEEIIAAHMTTLGLLEHGVSIRWSWRTQLGAVDDVMDAYAAWRKVHFAVSPRNPRPHFRPWNRETPPSSASRRS